MFLRVFLVLLLPIGACADNHKAIQSQSIDQSINQSDDQSIELKVTKLSSSFSKDKTKIVRFSVPLESPHKGRLHKINCRLDMMGWIKSDKPIDTLSFVIFEGSKKQKTHELTAPPEYYGKNLNVYCLAQPRL